MAKLRMRMLARFKCTVLCLKCFVWKQVRKICQTIAFLSPATCMILSSLDLGLSPWQVVAILTSGLALSSFALSGLN